MVAILFLYSGPVFTLNNLHKIRVRILCLHTLLAYHSLDYTKMSSEGMINTFCHHTKELLVLQNAIIYCTTVDNKFFVQILDLLISSFVPNLGLQIINCWFYHCEQLSSVLYTLREVMYSSRHPKPEKIETDGKINS